MEHVDVAVIGGGQSGLAAAYALARQGLVPVVLEASEQAAGSWPHYYDSLTLFSPARFSALPGMPFGGDPDRYPHRDEVVAYLTAYARRLQADIRTGHRVAAVRANGGGFTIELESGGHLAARAVIAASGSFGRPHRPALPGLDSFTGRVLHAADYRDPAPFTGQRVIVVGAGNSAVQIAAELARVGRTTLATRAPVKFARQHLLGRDLHFWLTRTGLDTAPLGRLLRTPPGQPVLDDGRYRAAVNAGTPDRRPIFQGLDGEKITWPDGTEETVDTIILATGYRPDLPYLATLDGTLDAGGRPLHHDGRSSHHPGLHFLGLEWQRSLSSNSLRGVGRDAERAARQLAAHLRAR
ncbi:putative oxidoreductase [Streptomyces scabiei 87.22]|uniref:Putative oxidoreductase n=1 Tax=Streptomyces scabiei (strain 87.22) TaxID=680198 RepID=C9YZ34_STRSW|nr:FAD-dependent oxidoreductase [Streptomyces scabiei]MDX2580720.1 NAD(P)-binding domain-containing protein [Streptomyces scabiei]MDX2659144.1 NAD(P)-binding domain-containing protein [Streptomyces scabiei]MDX2726205.1 NAD(P)-binding domain-containing protein [Streptomyces scabiei]MDX2871296.1 NAD(P)-binding domain-containing protein [Streptomyces scabiei]MDX2888692.1 NAD(P)-binding domain-containing protein [Streptomyces scabiei]